MDGTPLLLTTTVTGAFVVGMLLALLGSIKLPLAQRLGIDETRVGLLLSALTLALIPMMLVSGLLIDKWGAEGVLTGGCLLAAVGIGCLEWSRSFRAGSRCAYECCCRRDQYRGSGNECAGASDRGLACLSTGCQRRE